jgi:phosphatidylglycerol lysyltransferase
MKSKIAKILAPVFGLVILCFALYLLYHELQVYHPRDIIKQVEALPVFRLLLSLLFVCGSYLAATGYDTLSGFFIAHHLSYPRTALASFIGTSFSNNMGFGPLTGGSVRYRLYSAWGLTAVEIGKVVFFNTLSLWLGFLTLGGIFFTTEPMALPQALHTRILSARPIGVVFLIIVTTYFILTMLRHKPFKVRSLELSAPKPLFFFLQVGISVIDWGCAGAALYILLPASTQLSFSGFFGIYLLALIAGIISQVPGGLGVFETVMVLLLSSRIPAPVILGSLLAYRGLFYLLPLLIAMVLLTTQEALRKRRIIAKATGFIGRWAAVMVPPLLAFSTFVSGAVLLFSGATPALTERLKGLLHIFPLPVIEISHLMGSMVGVGLLLLARGIQKRIDAAYHLSVFLLGAGVVVSLLKGFDYEEAIILAVMLVALLPSRRYFYRKSSLFSSSFSPGWVLAIGSVLVVTVWLTLFAHKHVAYASQLWWQFTFEGNAPRSMRALVGASVVVFAVALAAVMRPRRQKPVVLREPDWDRVYAVVEQSPETYANLALLGDKRFLFSRNGSAFIMYNTSGRSWIAMGDPVGTPDQGMELAWEFRELSDRHNGWTVFYEIGTGNLPLYLDMGLTLLKLGEEARVPLHGFSLEGGSRKGLRHTVNRLEKEGYLCEVVPREMVPELLSEFKAISDAWLAEKNTREKGFSLGLFREKYLKNFSAGIVRFQGKVVAFTNLWSSGGKEELSIDLMRHYPITSGGVMEYLLIKLMLWGRMEGYRWFNLGMAPLGGLESRRLAPMWQRTASLVYRYGDHFYNFKGLRQYKEKFDPEWKPRYLAFPGGLALPGILANVASLISGGIRGIVTK